MGDRLKGIVSALLVLIALLVAACSSSQAADGSGGGLDTRNGDSTETAPSGLATVSFIVPTVT